METLLSPSFVNRRIFKVLFLNKSIRAKLYCNSKWNNKNHTHPHTRMIGIICPDNHGDPSSARRKSTRESVILQSFIRIRITCKQAYLISLVDG